MPRCRVKVIELIDQVLEFKELLTGCYCKGVIGEVYECDGCKTKRVLRLSRECIVGFNEEQDLLKVQLIGVQDAIEDRLQAFLRDDELSEEGEDPDE